MSEPTPCHRCGRPGKPRPPLASCYCDDCYVAGSARMMLALAGHGTDCTADENERHPRHEEPMSLSPAVRNTRARVQNELRAVPVCCAVCHEQTAVLIVTARAVCVLAE